jgi:hypothetical protein
MGDRTSVDLTILKAHQAKFEAFMKNQDTYESSYEDSDFVTYSFWEVNYGNLDFLADLIKLGIPFTSHWESGSEYGPGNQHLRFTPDGELQEIEVSDEYLNPDLSELIKRIDNYRDLKEYILYHRDRITPLPWDSQEEYAKIYLTKQLIAA